MIEHTSYFVSKYIPVKPSIFKFVETSGNVSLGHLITAYKNVVITIVTTILVAFSDFPFQGEDTTVINLMFLLIQNIIHELLGNEELNCWCGIL